MELGEIIRKLRRKHDLNQENVAEAVGVHKTTIINWEKGDNSITHVNLLKLAQVFDMTLPEMLSYDDDDASDGIVVEPVIPYKVKRKKGQGLKIIVELDGSQDVLKFWTQKLESINNLV